VLSAAAGVSTSAAIASAPAIIRPRIEVAQMAVLDHRPHWRSRRAASRIAPAPSSSPARPATSMPTSASTPRETDQQPDQASSIDAPRSVRTAAQATR